MTGGRYSADAGYFQRTTVISPPLSAPGANGPNGVYRAGTGFPTSTFQGGNYWVDVVWAETAGVDTRKPQSPRPRHPSTGPAAPP